VKTAVKTLFEYLLLVKRRCVNDRDHIIDTFVHGDSRPGVRFSADRKEKKRKEKKKKYRM